MSIWDKIQDLVNKKENSIHAQKRDISCYAFIDTEVGVHDHKIHDIGAIRYDGAIYRGASRTELFSFLKNVDYLCGHNIIQHDAKYLIKDENRHWQLVDTLYISPLLFPERPYHKLLKDEKLIVDELNNPINDCQKVRDLLMDEIAHWRLLSEGKRNIFTSLLHKEKEFAGFFEIVEENNLQEIDHIHLCELIKTCYQSKICSNADLNTLIKTHPIELSYALALIDTTDHRSITPSWVLKNYPNVENVVRQLRHKKCNNGCDYCNSQLNIRYNLKSFFGYDQFRTYENEPLQENAVQAAVDGKSLLAIFPTGGGKSLTFQLPALIEGRSVHGLTVVISPLQSLMKDQVDNLANRGITDVVTINGQLDPISRSLSIQRVLDGDASLLYIAPEMLRSKTIERILLARHVVRFVIDEAHCFSAWGQDFRVDYLYISKFIREYQNKKGIKTAIPISCFTATAKQKVIQDICDYFKQSLGITLDIFASNASRTNLQYSVIHTESDDDKYQKLRGLISTNDCPTIVYVSRTKRTKDLAQKLSRDGYKALPYNGKMSADEKIINQEEFMNDHVRIIVATSAFGMGVDKQDVGLVIHYDISDSLENYVQEAGRAGRDPNTNARCYVLYSDNDLDKHFILLNQTKLSISEIQQIWKAIKELTRHREKICSSALEIARKAGWDDSVLDIETRVRTAIAALEQSGYLERGNNVPHVYATGITVKNMDEARKRITESILFDKDEIENAIRIIKSLISQKNISKAQDPEGESRIDYLADTLGLNKYDIISSVERMRQEGILADSKDMSVFLIDSDTERKTRNLLDKFARLEHYILERISNESLKISYKQLNEDAINYGIETSLEKDIKTLLYFLTIKGYTYKNEDAIRNIELIRKVDKNTMFIRYQKRIDMSRFIVEWFYKKTLKNQVKTESKTIAIQFSIVELLKEMQQYGNSLFNSFSELQIGDIEEALLYLSKIGALKLEGGFLVLYNAMEIRRIKDNKRSYKQEDYRILNEFYKQKIQQVHIVGEYANLMVRDYNAALQYVQDYFQMDYKKFISKYFKEEERQKQIQRNITPNKYKQLFSSLSKNQLEIINDKESRCIVVAAGPGSGKTRVLVHKLASLLLLEDVKHEQLLMLTFSRAAATEFKQRLINLIGNAAHFVEIKTFHSYCFDLLGRIGNLEDAGNVVAQAANMIARGEVEPNRIGKTVLVIDEAQDMSADEYALVHSLMAANEDMRVIAVGDDDQNIYEFRGSNSCHMQMLIKIDGSRFIEMTDNYRSTRHIVKASNTFAKHIHNRLKKTPINSMSNEDGWISIVSHSSIHMYEPLVAELIKNKISCDQTQGNTTCILTQTNDEAAILVALLRKQNINSKFVQSMDGIRFWNLAEMRYFLKFIDKNIHAPLIPDELWESAKQSTYKLYYNSESLVYVKNCITQFETTNRLKYYSDFKEYVFESSIEDFGDYSDSDVIVSTIHKSKGHEFDDVYMLINGGYTRDDQLMRRYYVGITRAKKRLFIHTNTNIFNCIVPDVQYVDLKQYGIPEEIVLQMSYKDINLGFFKNRKNEVLELRGGSVLTYVDHFFYDSNNKCVAKLSNRMQQILAEWEEKGYNVCSAKVRFIVAWKPQDAPKDEKEIAVILPDLYLKKKPLI